MAGTEQLFALEDQWTTTRDVESAGVVGTIYRRVYRMRWGTDPATNTQLAVSYKEGEAMPDADAGATIGNVQFGVGTENDGGTYQTLILVGFRPKRWGE